MMIFFLLVGANGPLLICLAGRWPFMRAKINSEVPRYVLLSDSPQFLGQTNELFIAFG